MAIEYVIDDKVFFADNDWPEIPLKVTNKDGSAYDITGCTFQFTVFLDDGVTPAFTKSNIGADATVVLESPLSAGNLYVTGIVRVDTVQFKGRPNDYYSTVQMFDVAGKLRQIGFGSVPVRI